MWTKAALVNMAFGELALAGFVYDLTPEELQSAAAKMEAMVGTWLGRGVQMPYAFAGDPTAIDLDVDSGVPMTQAETVYMNLAVRLAAGFGKTLTGATLKAASEGLAALMQRAAFPPPVQLPNTLPVGAGGKRWATTRNPFMPPPDTGPLQPAEDGGLNLRK